MEAIHKALEWSTQCNHQKITIATDSQSSIKAIAKFIQRNPKIQEIQQRLKTLAENQKFVQFQWVKAHIGIEGNERADQLAKEASRQSPSVNTLTPPSWLKRLAHRQALREWQDEWDTDSTGRRTYSFFPKVSESSLVRNASQTALFTNHGPYRSYLYRFHLANSELCICGRYGDADHYCFECPLTKEWHLKKPNPSALVVWAKSIAGNQTLRSKASHIYNWLQAHGEELSHP